MIKRFIKFIFDILFPIECVSCGRYGSFICDDCFFGIEINHVEPFLNDAISEVHIASSYHQKIIRQAIHLFKYKFIESLSKPLSQILIDYFDQVEDKLSDPIVVPVPLHKTRLRERCFNQSQLLANYFVNEFGYVLKTDLIIRKSNTKHQAGLNREERVVNLKNSFVVKDPDFIKDKNFLILDDVYTTGSTVLEIAKLLKQCGAKEVWCLVIAKN